MKGWYRLPEIPYTEVESAFIRDAIRDGEFDDLEYRRYVNKLVHIEWFAREWPPEHISATSGMGLTVRRWKLAAEFPEAYDIINAELGSPTRTEELSNRPTYERPEPSPEDIAKRQYEEDRCWRQWNRIRGVEFEQR